MSKELADHRLVELDEKICHEITGHFAGRFIQYSAFQQNLSRLEENLSKYSLVASLAAAKAAPIRKAFPTAGGEQWHKCVELMGDIILCHRPTVAAAEYAIVELSPERCANEIHHRGWNAVEVLQAFARAQRQTLQAWANDLTAEVKGFLAEKHPGQNSSLAADNFISRFLQPLPQPGEPSAAQRITFV